MVSEETAWIRQFLFMMDIMFTMVIFNESVVLGGGGVHSLRVSYPLDDSLYIVQEIKIRKAKKLHVEMT